MIIECIYFDNIYLFFYILLIRLNPILNFLMKTIDSKIHSIYIYHYCYMFVTIKNVNIFQYYIFCSLFATSNLYIKAIYLILYLKHM